MTGLRSLALLRRGGQGRGHLDAPLRRGDFYDVNLNSLPGTCLHWNEVRGGRSLETLLSRNLENLGPFIVRLMLARAIFSFL